ncbi:MAG: RNA-binding protein [Desulfuromonadales bacterium]|nr:RNA-binding protein [Desulfuromonadales bacterium]
MSKDLYVKNLSQQTTEEDIRTLFAVAGKVTYIHMVVDPKTEQFLGCAYVKMSSEAEAKDAINALNEARYMNSYISVDVALPRTPAGTARPPSPKNKKAARPATAVATEKKRDKAIAKGDWTGPAPTKKATPRRKDGEGGRSTPDWTSTPTESAPSSRRKSSGAPRSGSPRKGPGPKRDK